MVPSLGGRIWSPGELGQPIIVLTGLTASGKTELLRRLGSRGEQILDLEHLARHRGSAFGNLGRQPQPRHRDFQAQVRTVVSQARPDRLLWVEDEGDFIGSVGLPPELTSALRQAPGIQVTDAPQARIARILAGYGQHPLAAWQSAATSIAARLGPARTELIRSALADQDLAAAIQVLLSYYDAGYSHRVAALGRPVLGTVSPGELDAARALAANLAG